MNGITQFIRLALDRAQAAKAEEELKQSLKRGTDPKAAEQNLSRVERKFDSLVGVAKKAGAAMLGFFAIRQVGAFASEMFNLGTAAEETASKFSTVFGPAETQVQTFLDSWARLAGLNKTVARDMAATAAITVQGMGASKEASATFSEQVMRLAGDLASMHNQTTPEMFDRIRAGLSGQMEPLSRYTGMISAADIQQRALVLTGKSHVDQLTALEKAQASLTVMYERAGVAVGDLGRTQDSTANRAKALQADFDNLKIGLATELMPAFERLVGFLTENQPAIASFGAAMVTMVETIGAELQAFARDLRIVQGLWYDLKDMARNPIQWFKGPSAQAPGTSGLDFGADRAQKEEAARIMAERRDGGAAAGAPAAPGGETAAQRKARIAAAKKAERERIAADKKAARERASEAKKAAKDASKDAEEEQQRAWRTQAGFQNELAGRGMDQIARPGINTRTMAMQIVGSYEKEQAAILKTADVWREAHRDMENATQSVAMGIMDSFGSAIEMMVTGAGTIGDAFVGLGAGIAADVLGGLKQLATGKVAEEIAWAFSSFARGNVPGGTAALLAAAKWAAAGGVAAGLGGAMGGVGRGGSMHRGAGTYGRQAADRADPRPEVHVYNKFTLDPRNPNTAKFIYKAHSTGVELVGRPEWARKGSNP